MKWWMDINIKQLKLKVGDCIKALQQNLFPYLFRWDILKVHTVYLNNWGCSRKVVLFTYLFKYWSACSLFLCEPKY